MKLRLCALAIAIAFPAASLAADGEVLKIEVSGAKADLRREETAASIVVGKEELLRQGDRTLADALKRVPGVSVGKGGELRMRGLGNGYTQVLLNGVAVPPGFAVDSLAPELVERVDILRSASAELGTQAIAGSINIILRKSAPRARQEAKLALDALSGERSPSLAWQASDKRDGYAYTVATAASRTTLPASRRFEETLADPDGGLPLLRMTSEREYNVARAASIAPRFTWNRGGDTLASQSFLNLYERSNGFVAHESALASAPTQFPDSGRHVDLRGFLLRSDLSWQRPMEHGARLEARLGGTWNPRSSDFEFHSLADGVRSPDLKAVHSDIRELGATFSGKYQLPLGGGRSASHTLALGWDGGYTTRSQTRVEQDRTVGMDYDERYRGSIARAALFAQDEWEIAPAWSLSAGVRWEVVETEVATRGQGATAQRSPVLSPVLQTLLKLSPQRQMRLALARTFKAPAMQELIPRRYTVDNNNSATNPDNEGNPALRPELAWGLDAGYEQYFGKEGMFSASAYARRIDDVTLPLLFRDRDRWVVTKANQGRAQAYGIALEAKGEWMPGLSLRANLARNWSRVASVPGPDNRLDRQAPLSANAGFDYQALPALKVGVDLNYQRGANTRVSLREASGTDSVRKLDLYATWQWSAATRLRIGAANLLRRDGVELQTYTDAAGVRRVLTRTDSAPTLRASVERNW
ncbi:TonB-dependent receptor [Pseudoduganella sp. LjRoot289]|uniref:TonB-dependent receptor plug domain-containing protein n=1 Tax=Pseudoduganella sp. LjRoot289 TaxID=3342314 RepID=UPI003ECC52C1